MIKDIEIQNFRCFEHTKIEGFERVNLIGGKNNAGKTALLEALIVSENPNNILYLKKLRKKTTNTDNEDKELKSSIQNLYYKEKIDRAIQIDIENDDNTKDSFKISFLEDISKEFDNDEVYRDLSLYLMRRNPSRFNEIKPVLKIENLSKNHDKEIDIERAYKFTLPCMFILTPEIYLRTTLKGKLNGELNPWALISQSMPIIATFWDGSSLDLVHDYEWIVLHGKENELLKAFQVLDSRIEKIEGFSIASPRLYLTLKGEKRLPIDLFGDAINRLAQIIMKLLKKENSILLIDEIENGIHYTNQRKFWKMLFGLAQELNTQIFATTHSIEMIRAFADVGLEDYPDQGAYFELARSPKTDKILGIKSELDLLDYALKHNDRVRGE